MFVLRATWTKLWTAGAMDFKYLKNSHEGIGSRQQDFLGERLSKVTMSLIVGDVKDCKDGVVVTRFRNDDDGTVEGQMIL
jgi:hypothetical protein